LFGLTFVIIWFYVSDRLEDTARFLVNTALRESTHKTYGSAQRKYQNFCIDLGIPPLPASDDTLIKFVSYLFTLGLKGSTIRVYLAAVRSWHVINNFPPPEHSERLLLAIKGALRLSGPVCQKFPISFKMLGEMFPWLDGRHDEILLKCVMSLSFFGCFRSGELCLPDGVVYSGKSHLSYEDVTLDSASSVLTLLLKQSKTDTFDVGVKVRVGCSGSLICAYCLMKQYLEQHPTPVRGKALFLDCNLQVLKKSYFVATTKIVLALAGYDPVNYSGHSYRAGSATAGASVGFTAWELKMLGRWSSEAYHLYLRDPAVVTSFSRRLAVKE
jgi:hypothetical protein